MPLSDLLFGLGGQPPSNSTPANNLTGLLSSIQQQQQQQPNGLLAGPYAGALRPATANQNMMTQALAARGQAPNTNNDPSWYREDGTKKGNGFLGLLPFHDGRTSSELSIGVNLGGKEVSMPTLVPTLEPQEILHLLSGGQPTPEIIDKAVAHARMRMQQGLSPFAD